MAVLKQQFFYTLLVAFALSLSLSLLCLPLLTTASFMDLSTNFIPQTAASTQYDDTVCDICLYIFICIYCKGKSSRQDIIDGFYCLTMSTYRRVFSNVSNCSTSQQRARSQGRLLLNNRSILAALSSQLPYSLGSPDFRLL